MKTTESILYLVPKETYYDKKSAVIKEAKALHQLTMEEDRELYTYLLFFQEATYFSKSLIIQNLLAHSLNKPSHQSILQDDPIRLQIEDELIYRSLLSENMTHALKMLLSLKENEINNARTSRLILKFLFRRKNLDRLAIKYKKKIQSLLIHALGKAKMHHIVTETEKGNQLRKKWIDIYRNPKALEIIKFVCNQSQTLTSDYLRDYQNVKENFEQGTVHNIGKSTVPIEVMGGFNNQNRRYMSIMDLATIGKVSDKQRIQLQNAVKKASNHEVELKIDLSKYGIMALYKLLYSNKDEDGKQRKEAQQFIQERAQEIREKGMPSFFKGEDFAVIVDVSDSNYGSAESHLHPLYKNLALAEVLQGTQYVVGGRENEAGLMVPSGDSNLSQALINAVRDGHQNILILSDGYENVGSVEKVFNQMRTMGYHLNLLHLNPVFSPKNYAFKTLGDSIPSLPFQDVEHFGNLELFYMLNQDPELFKTVMRSKIESLMFEKQEVAVSQ